MERENVYQLSMSEESNDHDSYPYEFVKVLLEERFQETQSNAFPQHQFRNLVEHAGQQFIGAHIKKEQPVSQTNCSAEENSPFGMLKTENSAELEKKLIPDEKELPPDVEERANEILERENENYFKFIDWVLKEYPVEETHNPRKARKHASNGDGEKTDEIDSEPSVNRRKIANDRCFKSRHIKDVESAIDGYSVIYLQERILEYELRMEFMKQMFLQSFADDWSGK